MTTPVDAPPDTAELQRCVHALESVHRRLARMLVELANLEELPSAVRHALEAEALAAMAEVFELRDGLLAEAVSDAR